MQSGNALIILQVSPYVRHYGFLDTASLFGQFVFEEFHDIHHLLVSLADQLARGSVAES